MRRQFETPLKLRLHEKDNKQNVFGFLERQSAFITAACR